MIRIIATFAIGLVGVALFHRFDLPLPWLLGPLTACLITALLGAKLRGIAIVNEAMRTILGVAVRSEEHTSELQSLTNLVCRLLLEKKKTIT